MTEAMLFNDLPLARSPGHDYGPLLVGKPRPGRHHDLVVEAAAKVILPDVMGWMMPDESPEEEVLDDLKEAIRRGDDGYDMAKFLDDRKHWSVDKDLIDILDGLCLWSHQDKLVRQWAAANDIKPEFSVGERVVHPRRGAGTIVRIEAGNATYIVKMDGCTDASLTGAVLPFEECTAEGEE